jgi:hypothetical protein
LSQAEQSGKAWTATRVHRAKKQRLTVVEPDQSPDFDVVNNVVDIAMYKYFILRYLRKNLQQRKIN